MEKAMKIYIWGTGKWAECVEKILDTDKCELMGYIDNDPGKQGKYFGAYKIIGWQEISNFDYIIISVVRYQPILYQLKNYVHDEKIICFFDEKILVNSDKYLFIKAKDWKIAFLQQKVESLEQTLGKRIENLPYEIEEKAYCNLLPKPQIENREKVLTKIIKYGCSIIRFGDGEFDIMMGKNHPVFQDNNEELAEKLKKIIQSEEKKLLIAIADNYGNLDKYTEEVADGIRQYMTKPNIREFHNSVLDMKRTYYDAYTFKCYYPYKDKSKAEREYTLVKRIWQNRGVTIIEGDKTRTGVRNDLLYNARSIRRILAPTCNAFKVYNRIFEQAIKIKKDDLILIALGPAGKVMAYDLFLEGYQVIDIGQMDTDYEMYMAKSNGRIPNAVKYVADLPAARVEDIYDDDYKKQIIARIE